MFGKKFYLVILLFVFKTGFSQNLNKEKLDAYFQALDANRKFMGSVAISQNGQIVYSKTIGYADVETQKKADANTRYRIGSISKTFTAVLVFKAIEENKIALTQTIDKFFPAIKNAGKITVSNLLNHRSGIHNFTNDPDYEKWNTGKKSRKEMVDLIVTAGSDFEPGSKAAYSNSNYVLLSVILEEIYKKPLAGLVEQYITKPAGLKYTKVGGKISVADNEANSYKFTDNWVRQSETDMSIPIGAGALISTPEDLTRFADALFGGKLISEKSLAEMKTLKENFGMGLFPIPFYDKMSLGHSGGIDGFQSVFGYFPEQKIAYAITSNGSAMAVNSITIAMLNAVFGMPVEIPDFKVYSPAPADLDLYPGTYASNQIPIKITVTRSGTSLTAQATNQPSFTLEATDKHKFKFDAAGLVMEFKPAEKKMILRQGGGVFDFRKE
ncbi:serine hydrolase domain-containing protein [Dyadobacter aurulentus]|uniref:serine hydrolase domain-containing protein n=1 Tax=Dyadobacter sp. UC 10 TaxID=2605428 RepID=UPI0011F2D56E|nr:serine hydrolase domain-containing protein [Dyadobacter sp. UC 10]KAA0992969.1 beta-lactamase family protein [Dyadobacter sp. UC 10]